MPSLNEIAREIGISAATISRVLNGRPGIAEKTRKDVLSALEQRGYPKKAVRGGFQTLRNGSSTIAFAISGKIRELIERGDPFYGRHLMAMQAACSQMGYYPILVDYEQDATPDGGLRCVDEQRVHGVVAELMPPELVERLRQQVGVVLLNIVSPVPKVDYIIPDIRQAAREQVQHLYDLGHRAIACFRSLPGGWQNHYYWSEFWWMTKRLNLDLPPEYFDTIDFSLHEEREAATGYLEKVLNSSRPPTAIITGDNYAPLLIELCQQRGLQVPQRMSIVGFDDRALVPGSVPLTTYRQNFEGMARESLRLLIDRCEHPDLPARTVEVEGTIIHRDSVAAPRT
ncbi:MAG TPA: LacI family DNA-binding transcriptional regulator [Terrimicrobiaceae bacterium]|nr:LacI family DNA-binding transcriptional regulator [Terrimicrobiaceae bacterium]